MLTYKNIDEAYYDLVKNLKEHGRYVDFDGNNKRNKYDWVEIPFYKLTIEDPSQSIIRLKGRNISLKYVVAETLWYFSKRNDAKFIEQFASLWTRIKNEDGTVNSAYGYLVHSHWGFDQLDKCIEELTIHPNSRKAVIHIGYPIEDMTTTKDKHCTLAIQFMLRDGSLDAYAIMRSNDIIHGTTFDFLYFITLQKIVAKRLGVKLGSYSHLATSMHYYAHQEEQVDNILAAGLEINESKPYDVNIDAILEWLKNHSIDEINPDNIKEYYKQFLVYDKGEIK